MAFVCSQRLYRWLPTKSGMDNSVINDPNIVFMLEEWLEATDATHHKNQPMFCPCQQKKCIAWLCPHSKVDSLASLVTSSRVFDVAYPSSCLIGLALEMKRTNQMMYYAWRSQTQHRLASTISKKHRSKINSRFNDARLSTYRLNKVKQDEGLGVAEALDCSRLLFIQKEPTKHLHKH